MTLDAAYDRLVNAGLVVQRRRLHLTDDPIYEVWSTRRDDGSLRSMTVGYRPSDRTYTFPGHSAEEGHVERVVSHQHTLQWAAHGWLDPDWDRFPTVAMVRTALRGEFPELGDLGANRWRLGPVDVSVRSTEVGLVGNLHYPRDETGTSRTESQSLSGVYEAMAWVAGLWGPHGPVSPVGDPDPTVELLVGSLENVAREPDAELARRIRAVADRLEPRASSEGMTLWDHLDEDTRP
jgi:hypothetical protein